LPQYFFHLRDHVERLLDPQGRAIDDPATIAAMTLSEARALIAHDALEGSIDLGQRLEVEDESGAIVHVLRFSDAVEILGLER
jgi:hypothetical protein